tara:strand:- start:985 stop:4596 length:3612 start_codon:yes stop_codon:yes gene_type:complete
MASITQTIHSYTGGISQQPDERKIPGQVVKANNVLPDITQGLLKRPGSKLIKSLSDGTYNSVTNGRWFHYYRDENEQYIGQISRAGSVRMWRCSDGQEITVNYSGLGAVTNIVIATNGNGYTSGDHAVTIGVQWAASTSYSIGDQVFNASKVYTAASAGSSGSTAPTHTTGTVTDGNVTWTYAGVQATATVTASNQIVISATITNNGSGYTSAPPVTIAAPNMDISGTATATATAEIGVQSYLQHTSDEDIQTLTLNDYTYINNRLKTVSMSDTIEPTRTNEAFIELKKIAYASQYALNIYNDDTTTTTYTATRISIKRTRDSSNSCDTHSTHTLRFPASGTEPGTGGYTTWCLNTDNEHQDSYCPNVGTRVFAIDHGTAIDSEDINGVTGRTVSVTISGGGAQADRKHLNFRISTIGQAVPEGSASDHDYRCRYTTTHDLLYGGQGWRTGDYFYVWMNNAQYKITIEDHSEAIVKANAALVRPKPTPFDSKTTITAESILGDIQKEIIGTNIGAVTGVTLTNAGKWYDVTAGNPTFSGGGGTGASAYVVLEMPGPGYEGKVHFLGLTSGGSGYTSAPTLTFPAPDPPSGYTGVQATGTATVSASGAFAASDIEFIGNGLYIKDNIAFNVSTPSGELLNVITSECQDVANLPSQCKHGYVVKVRNGNADEDDYYVKFFGENDRDGPGTWEECPQPGRKVGIDPYTAPIQLVREANGTFTLSEITWENCLVGDTTTVPEPSFVGKTINKMLFFRNRLVLLSDENVILSQPGEFFNFWPKSAITFTPSDVIDLSCSSEYPAIVYDAIQANAGLVLFTKNQQFLLTTDSDVLSPNTAKINSLSTYNFNYKSNPISLGTTLAFLDNAGKYTRFWEMARVLREGEPDVVDQSKIVSKLFDKDLDKISNSRENGVVFFSKKDTSTLYGFRYFSASDKRIQQAWFTWEFPGKIQHHAVLDDSLFLVLRNNSKDVLQKVSIKMDTDSATVTDDLDTTDTSDDITYRIHLDNWSTVSIAANTYNSSTNKTTFPKPATGYEASSNQLALYDNSAGSGNADPIGKYVTATINGSNLEVTGDWSNNSAVLGYLFDMEVEFPKIYQTQQSGETSKSTIQGSLIIHRVKLNFGANGLFSTTLDRIGKPSYTETYEPVISDSTAANQIAINPDNIETIPIYEKNTNMTLTLKSTHPSPATLYSMSWEGDYTNQFYRSV